MSNIMLDLETMGTGSNSAITAIGAVKFSSKGLGEEFYRVVDLGSCVDAGLTIDPSTVMWWMQQSDEARKALCKSPTKLDQALLDFNLFVGDSSVAKIWGNGSDFDNVILANAYQKLNMPMPWRFYNSRCYRTVKNLLGGSTELVRVGTAHNALDDAKSQADHLIKIMNLVGRK